MMSILVETVGVGQSETTVRDMVDFFMLVVLTGAGDGSAGHQKGDYGIGGRPLWSTKPMEDNWNGRKGQPRGNHGTELVRI